MKTSGSLGLASTKRRYKAESMWLYQPMKKSAVQLADRTTPNRRATFDLTGLPPTPAEVDALVNNTLPEEQAIAKVMERLLASPHCGAPPPLFFSPPSGPTSGCFRSPPPKANSWR